MISCSSSEMRSPFSMRGDTRDRIKRLEISASALDSD